MSENGVAGINLVLTYGAKPAGDLTQEEYMVVGTLADVVSRMPSLVKKVRATFEPTIFDEAFFKASRHGSDTLGGWQAAGIPSGWRTGAVYDPAMYSTYNPAMQGKGGTDKLSMFIQQGQAQGQRASLEFDPAFYLAQNPDVAAAVSGDPRAAAEHWQATGIDEGRAGSADFDPRAYLTNYSDLSSSLGAQSYRLALYHWILQGKAEGRNGTAVQTVAKPASPITTNANAASVNAPSMAPAAPVDSQAAQAAAQAQAQVDAQNAAQAQAQAEAQMRQAAAQAAQAQAQAVQTAAQQSQAAAQAAATNAFTARQTQTVYRYNSPAGHAFSLSADRSNLPAQFTLEGAVFSVYLAHYANTSALYRCNTEGHQFLSTDSGCEGQTFKGLIGYIGNDGTNGLNPLYRTRNSASDYLEDNNADQYTSAGYTVDGILGYTP